MFPSKTKTGSKKGFTLIELLIVIVILGILIAALVPRLTGARARANDAARKGNLYQVGVALVAYQMDHGKVPVSSGGTTLGNLSGELMGVGISSIPEDPDPARAFSGLGTSMVTGGQYGYITITKGGIDNRGFVVMAGSETPGGSNRVTDGSNYAITGATRFEDINQCTKFVGTESGTLYNGGTGLCTYDSAKDQLRYIYMY